MKPGANIRKLLTLISEVNVRIEFNIIERSDKIHFILTSPNVQFQE